MPRKRKCNCDSEKCFTCHNRHNWERWKGKRPRVESSEPSDEELDRRARDLMLWEDHINA